MSVAFVHLIERLLKSVQSWMLRNHFYPMPWCPVSSPFLSHFILQSLSLVRNTKRYGNNVFALGKSLLFWWSQHGSVEDSIEWGFKLFNFCVISLPLFAASIRVCAGRVHACLGMHLISYVFCCSPQNKNAVHCRVLQEGQPVYGARLSSR